MKLKRIMIPIVTAILVLSTFGGFSSASVSDPFTGGTTEGIVKLPDYHSPGSYVDHTDSIGIQDKDTTNPSSDLFWTSPISSDEWVKFAIGDVQIDGNPSGKFLHYDLTSRNTKNGYPLVPEQDVEDWINNVKGDSKYVKNRLQAEVGSLRYKSDKWDVYLLANLVSYSGANILNGKPLRVNSDGMTATPVFRIQTTPPPESGISMDKQIFDIGEQVKFTLNGNLYAANTAYHMEAVEITGPNGYSQFLEIQTQADGKASAATGHNFPLFGPGSDTATAVWGGGSGDPNSPKQYTETADLNTTGLTAGTYTVKYTLYDGVGRIASNGPVLKQFTVGTGLPPEGNISSDAVYDFGSNQSLTYTPRQQMSSFPALTLTLGQNNLAEVSATKDILNIEYSLDNGAYQPLTTAWVYDSKTNQYPKTISVPVPLSLSWSEGTHTIKFRVSSKVGNTATYSFNSTDSGQMEPLATVTYTLNPAGSTNQNTNGKLAMRFVEIPTQVPMFSDFDIVVEISNDADVAVTTNLRFELQNAIRSVPETRCNEDDCDTVWVNYPLTESINSGDITISPHNIQYWRISSGLYYDRGGFTRNMNAEGPRDRYGSPESDKRYVLKADVKAMDPNDFTAPEIWQYIGTNYPTPERPGVHLTQ